MDVDLAAIQLAATTRNVVAFMLSRSAAATNAGPMAATAWRSPAEGSSEENAEAPLDASASVDALGGNVGGTRVGSEMVTAATVKPGWWTSVAAVWLPGWGTVKLKRR